MEVGSAGPGATPREGRAFPSADANVPARIEVYPSRLKLALLFLGACGFVVLGSVVPLAAEEQGIAFWKVVLVSYVGVPFFGAIGLYLLGRLLRRRPSLVIDAEGILVSASAVGGGRLRWEELERVVLYEVAGQPMLGIVPRDPEAYLRRVPLHARLMARLNLVTGWPPIHIPQAGLDMKLVDLARLLQARRAAASASKHERS